MPSLTPEQIRAARALLGWRQEDLAEKSGVSVQAIGFIETHRRNPKAKTLDRLETALSAAGIEIVKGGVAKID